MRDQIEPTRIEREAIYDEATARHLFRLAGATLARARRDGRLRYTRSGARILYLGEWLLEWLRAASESELTSEAAGGRREDDDSPEEEGVQ